MKMVDFQRASDQNPGDRLTYPLGERSNSLTLAPANNKGRHVHLYEIDLRTER